MLIIQMIHHNTVTDDAIENNINIVHKQWHVGMDMSAVKSKDWHNYQEIAEDAQRTGNT